MGCWEGRRSLYTTGHTVDGAGPMTGCCLAECLGRTWGARDGFLEEVMAKGSFDSGRKLNGCEMVGASQARRRKVPPRGPLLLEIWLHQGQSRDPQRGWLQRGTPL